MKPIRRKTLQEFEDSDRSEPTYNSYLVSTIHGLRRKPIGEFTTEDLRIMIGQNIGLPYLLPLALERLEENPLAEGDYYPGDLLSAVLRVEKSFWSTRSAEREAVDTLLRRVENLLAQRREEGDEAVQEALQEGTEIFRTSETERQSLVDNRNV